MVARVMIDEGPIVQVSTKIVEDLFFAGEGFLPDELARAGVVMVVAGSMTVFSLGSRAAGQRIPQEEDIIDKQMR